MSQPSSMPGMDPSTVVTPRQLRSCLRALRERRGLSYAELDDRAGKMAPLQGRKRRLPASTLSDLLADKDIAPSKDVVLTFLAACSVSRDDLPQWLAAWERASTAELAMPEGAVRVSDARPRLLGVHASIQVDDSVADDQPDYVARDVDAALGAALDEAAKHGGFILLLGGSSVGKTRTLCEAVKAKLPQWWLLHPRDTDALCRHAENPTPRTVVWVDELQRYLNGYNGLPAGAARTLIAAGTVLVGTLWPDEYTRRIAAREPGTIDPHDNDRQLLRLAHVIDIPPAFSPDEQQRARLQARKDARLRLALTTPDAGITQILAAGPELVRWWENAPHPYGKAVITAALDARRVGAQPPLTKELLAAAAPSYLTLRQRATASADWLDQALSYATTPVHGAAATLTPIPGAIGQVAGYDVADYLHQHAGLVRRTTRLPDEVWQALVDHHDARDVLRLADSAERRGRAPYAEAFYRRALDAGHRDASSRLAELLRDRGSVDEAITVLRRAVDDTGRNSDAIPLFHLLAMQNRIDELTSWADAGNVYAADRLAELLMQEGKTDELIERAMAGDRQAAFHLAEHFTREERFDAAASVLQPCAEAGDEEAEGQLADLLALSGQSEQAATIWIKRAKAGDRTAVRSLARLGRNKEALSLWRARDTDNTGEDWVLVDLLLDDACLDEVARIADAGGLRASYELARYLADHGHIEQLTLRADAGDDNADQKLAQFLAEHQRIDEVRQRADAGSWHAIAALGSALTKKGELEEAYAIWCKLAEAGEKPAANGLAEQLATPWARHGHVDQALAMLRPQADAELDGPDERAGSHLAYLLAEHDRLEELAERAETGSRSATSSLIKTLADQGRIKDAINWLTRHPAYAAESADSLAHVLTRRGEIDQAISVLRRFHADDMLTMSHLVELLEQHDRREELTEEVAAGTHGAVQALHDRSARLRRR
ncbi:hypothetical protein GCM10023084_79290 [Streptomyces lacrimifluminis]|uniref:Tetratricopeptide repeat protein n=1 Tax=Streptomyces lacrimifluminis TaxID=1500077 RepID=A0A917UN55_9ACTN|nr:XRE family transcriptional regulator [Streptomyces lacrimifluminis]GGJ69653.1 hypothetical protein GCM10012282_78220 [Streptomyces lacrimifluminis]